MLRVPVVSVLAASLLLPAVLAQTTAPAAAPAAAPPAANAVDPASVQALKDMGASLQALKRFEVSTDVTGERVLRDGQKLQHIAKADLKVVRPGKLRARISSARTERELIYDGKTATLYSPAQKYYSTVEMAGSVGDLIEKLEATYAVELPLADLFRWGTPNAPLDKFESAMNAGQDFVGKDLCDHYAFRQGKIDWQIWITAGEQKLPRKVVITNRGDEARPQSVSLITWNLKPNLPDATFKFTPVAGAKKIEMIERKAK